MARTNTYQQMLIMLTGKPKSNFDMVIPWEAKFYTSTFILLLINEDKNKMEVNMNYIYCYENKINHHKYVGQTNNLKIRYSAHESQAFNSNSKDYNCLFHKKIRQYGLNNFDFYTLEEIESDDQELIDSREVYWIQTLNTWCRYGQGYNETTGGKQFRKNISLTDNEIKEIKELLINTELEFTKIAERYNTYRDCISRINQGRYGFDPNQNYPIRITRDWREIPQDIKERIAEEIINTSLSLKEIANKYSISEHLINQINNGQSNLSKEYDYPLRKTNQRLTEEQEQVIYQMLSEGKKIVDITKATGVHRSTVNKRKKKYNF